MNEVSATAEHGGKYLYIYFHVLIKIIPLGVPKQGRHPPRGRSKLR